jgi:DNA-binding NarL/FixJ family response regulator
MKAQQIASRENAAKQTTANTADKRLVEASVANAVTSRPTDAGGSKNGAVRVLCVDDHAVLIEGLAARFAIEDGIELVGRLASASRLVEECERLKPNVVVLDIEMPGPDAFEVASRLKHHSSDIHVMILSAHIREAFITAAFRAGVCGYFAKSDDLSDIISGIFAVSRSCSNGFLIGPRVRESCRPMVHVGQTEPKTSTSQFEWNPASSQTMLALLTARELEILRLIGKGMSRTQIALELCRSAKTVDAHQFRMMKKLGITARADLMRLAIREGLALA